MDELVLYHDFGPSQIYRYQLKNVKLFSSFLKSPKSKFRAKNYAQSTKCVGEKHRISDEVVGIFDTQRLADQQLNFKWLVCVEVIEFLYRVRILCRMSCTLPNG
jgi:hypothetical protein